MACQFCEDGEWDITDCLREDHVKDLAASIALGDMSAASIALDLLFRDIDVLSGADKIQEWIANARASNAAKDTKKEITNV